MPDAGHKETDALLEKVEKKVDKVYSKAVKESKKNLNQYLKRFEKKDKQFQRMVKKNEMTKAEYLEWRKSQMLLNKHFTEVLNTISNDYVNADKIAMSIVGDHLPEAYAINRNFAAFEVEKGSLIDTSFTLYDAHTVERLIKEDKNLLPKPKLDIPKDKRWNHRKIREEVTKSVLKGDSIDQVAKNLQKVADMDRSAAIRNARTAITGAQNAGRVDGYMEAKKLGIGIQKEWSATLDSKTRHSHAMLDGEHIDVEAEFSNGCMYPGDPECKYPEEIYNCRCSLVARLTDFNFAPGERNSKLGDMSYDEWKDMHRVAFEAAKTTKTKNKYKSYEQSIKNARVFSESEHIDMNFNQFKWDAIKQSERQAVEAYTDEYYWDMNRLLRGEITEAEAGETIVNFVNNCETALDKVAIAEDTLLFRGMGDASSLARAFGISESETIEALADKSIVGMKFVERGFCSTGINSGAGWNKQISLEIVAPKGTKGMYVDLISANPGERELLLQRGATFMIYDVEQEYSKYKLKVVVTGFQK